MTLTEFLLARIAEDEGLARASVGTDGGEWFSRYAEWPDLHMMGEFGWVVSGPGVETEDSEWGKAVADHIARHDPARVLAECEAKLRMVQRKSRKIARGSQEALLDLMDMVLPYSGHPEYSESWRV